MTGPRPALRSLGARSTRVRASAAVALTALLATAGAIANDASAHALSTPKLCTLMESGKYFDDLILTKKAFSGQGGSAHCEWTDEKLAHVVALIVFDNKSVANAKALWNGSYAGHGRRVAIKGADAALLRPETKRRRGTSDTAIIWRRGRYTGSFAIAGPGDYGDLESAKDYLEPFLARVPRR